MSYQGTWKKFFTARAALLLPLLLFGSSLPTLAQVSSDDKQAPTGTNQTESKPPKDISKWPGFLVAVEGGSGLSSLSKPSPTAYGGIKIGGAGFTLDVGYDRIPAHNGFATEVSGMFPVFRFPGPQKDESKNYLRVFAEPGLGYRAGGGVGAYASAKVMIVLFSDLRLVSSATKWSPFIEFQHRFALQKSDTRMVVGIMMAICEHCGLD